MPEQTDERPILSTDSDETIEANIDEARLNNEYERTLVTEAPEGDPPIRATEVPRDDEHRGADATPVGYFRDPDARRALEEEVAIGPYVGPIDGEGTDEEEQDVARREGDIGGRRDEDGNLLHDPGIGPRTRATEPPGNRDENGDLIADHDGDGKAAAHEGPIRENTGHGVAPEASEEEQHGSRALDDEERDLDGEDGEPDLPPEHDPDASEEEQKGGRGADERDLGDAEAAGKVPEHSEFLDDAEVSDEAAAVATATAPVGAEAVAEGVVPEVQPEDVQPPDLSHPAGGDAGDSEQSPGPAAGQPAEDATADEWRQYAASVGVTVPPTANKALTKSALREAGYLR